MGLINALLGLIQGNQKQFIAHEDILVDVRSPEEFASGNIEGSINVPVNRIFVGMRKITPNLNAKIVVYCASGMRSSKARKALMQMGYNNVVNGGGIHRVARNLQNGIKKS